MEYKELTMGIEPFSEDIADALAAALGEVGFDGFMQTDSALLAYLPADAYTEDILEKVALLDFFRQNYKFSPSWKDIPDKDWNAEWEASFQPIRVDDDILIRAGFHEPDPQVRYDIVIEPKMSFGTGHHATTVLMLRTILSLGCLKGKRVLDMGCGTGILSLLASKCGADEVLGIDIDEWSYSNAMENMKKNGISNIRIKIGDAALLEDESPFDVILANINRNILLRDMERYVRVLGAGGTLVVSGFYEHENGMLVAEAERLGLEYVSHMENMDWCCTKFIKNV